MCVCIRRKILSMSQERQKIINTCAKRHSKFVNLYEYDNQLDLYKNM